MQAAYRRFLRHESGATAIEYGFIASMISIAAVAVYPLVGASLIATFTAVAAGF